MMMKPLSITKNLHVIVPVNIPSRSKMRLSRRLNANQRASLTLAMLTNVLTALRKAASVDSVTVVCADRKIQMLVEEYDATFLYEGKRRGLNSALNFAMRRFTSSCAILIIHADLPLLTSDDVDYLVRRSRNYPFTLIPSKDGTGTNAILMQSPSMITPAFGEGSFRKHETLAKKRRLPYKVLRIQGVAFDVDDEHDLDELMRIQFDKQTARRLRGLFEPESVRLLPILVQSR
jgi:2-phospho-L-lactate guanylyltransferase